MAENPMTRRRRRMIARGHDKFAAPQPDERILDGAFGKSGCVSERARTQRKRFPFITRSHTVEIKIDKIRGRLLIVPNQIAHQNVENIIVDWNDCLETRHDVDLTAIPLNGQQFLRQSIDLL